MVYSTDRRMHSTIPNAALVPRVDELVHAFMYRSIDSGNPKLGTCWCLHNKFIDCHCWKITFVGCNCAQCNCALTSHDSGGVPSPVFPIEFKCRARSLLGEMCLPILLGCLHCVISWTEILKYRFFLAVFGFLCTDYSGNWWHIFFHCEPRWRQNFILARICKKSRKHEVDSVDE